VIARFSALFAALALAACASGLAGANKAHGVAPPRGELPLGDYAKGDEAKLAADFSRMVGARYPAGLAMSAAQADLGRNKFNCAAPKLGAKPAGDPPDLVCRRVIKAGGCDHTWQVHLFDDDGGKPSVARVRGLYDRACGSDDLLGG
jgi:hypothetical protein